MDKEPLVHVLTISMLAKRVTFLSSGVVALGIVKVEAKAGGYLGNFYSSTTPLYTGISVEVPPLEQASRKT